MNHHDLKHCITSSWQAKSAPYMLYDSTSDTPNLSPICTTTARFPYKLNFWFPIWYNGEFEIKNNIFKKFKLQF